MILHPDTGSVLIVVAHPDDEVLGCGGLIAKYSHCIDFHVLFLCEGSTCRFSDPCSPEALSAVESRNDCAIKSLTYLGVKTWKFINLPCGKLDQTPLLQINKEIESRISDVKPFMLITHSECDANQDHIKTLNSCLISTRPYSCPVKAIISCEILSSTEWGFIKSFQPNLCCELSEAHITKKYQALSMYSSEIVPYPFPRSQLGVETLARFRGMQFGYHYGESYQLIRGSLL